MNGVRNLALVRLPSNWDMFAWEQKTGVSLLHDSVL